MKSINPFKSVIQTNCDIVKANGEEIKVETKKGEGSKFIIRLPTNIHKSNNPINHGSDNCWGAWRRIKGRKYG